MSNHFRDSNIRPASPIVFKSGIPVSVICVAATYTSVTYANNGGKVQLSSAGVHGLTTSPAVGSNVYVSWAGGIGVSGLYPILSVDSTVAFTIDLVYEVGLGTPTVAVANTEITITSVTLPALQPNSYIREFCVFSMTGSTNTKSIFNRLNGSLCGSMGTAIAANTGGSIIAQIKNQNSKSIQTSIGNLGGLGFLSTSNPTTNIDTSIPTTLSISFKPIAANEFLKIDSFITEVFI